MPWDSPESRKESKNEAKEHREERTEPRVSLIRGLEELELKAKQKEDEAKSAFLRGKLLEQIAASKEAEAEAPQLKGKLLKKEDSPETPKLRGKLLEQSESLEPYSKEWMTQQTFVQRDSNANFIFDSFHESRNGERIRLVCPENSTYISHNLERFTQRLQIPGEAWLVKKT